MNKNFVTGFVVTVALAAAYYIGKKAAAPVVVKPEKDEMISKVVDSITTFGKKVVDGLKEAEAYAEEQAKGKTKVFSDLEESELLGELDLVKLAADTAANGKKYLDMAVNLAILEFADEKAVKYLSTSLEVIPYTDDQTRERIKAAEKLWQSKGKYLEYCKKYETFIAEWKKDAPEKAKEIWKIAKEAKKTVTK